MNIEQALKYCEVLEDYYIDETHSLSEFINNLITKHELVTENKDTTIKVLQSMNDRQFDKIQKLESEMLHYRFRLELDERMNNHPDLT